MMCFMLVFVLPLLWCVCFGVFLCRLVRGSARSNQKSLIFLDADESYLFLMPLLILILIQIVCKAIVVAIWLLLLDKTNLCSTRKC